MILTFIKEESGKWYIDLPTWTGDKADLEMVSGADTLLEKLSDNENVVSLEVYEDYFKGSEELNMLSLANDLNNGAYYNLMSYKGEEVNLDLWLCDVTKFVFGYLPNKIYFKVINTYSNNLVKCPECGHYIKEKYSGVECPECDYFFCF